jgi:predicted DNA-binding transcriptional regulator AlpA
MHATDLLDCALPPGAIDRIANQISAKLKIQPTPLSADDLDRVADGLWTRMLGAGGDHYVEIGLRAKLVIEASLRGDGLVPFALDRLTEAETSAYAGVATQILHEGTRRRKIGFPEPYRLAGRLQWRRSEVDAWIERQRGGVAS